MKDKAARGFPLKDASVSDGFFVPDFIYLFRVANIGRFVLRRVDLCQELVLFNK